MSETIHARATNAAPQQRDLSSNWRLVLLGEVCEIIAGQSPPGSTYRTSPEGLPFFQGKADFGKTNPVARVWCVEPTKIARPGDILISVRAPVGPTNVAGVECCIGRGLAAIRCGKNSDRDFILNALRHFEATLVKKGSGSTFDAINRDDLESFEIPLPPLPEQRRIAEVLREQMAAVEKARTAAQARLEAAMALPASFVSESLATGLNHRYSLADCLIEIRNGIGASWSKYPVLGATRDGLSPAKEGVGKAPARYKLVDPVTVFYNPMRILLGSIAMVDDGDPPGITSPDYVVVKGRPGMLDTRWFYYWFRSVHGVNLIASLSRGAVRERILFNRLTTGVIDLPDYETQKQASDRMKHVQPVVEAVAAVEEELSTINALPAALLRRAFNGEL
jgi:type I restriction enzyme S subunit